VRIGVLLLPTDPWVETVQTAQRLERLGYHHLWVYDHLSWRRYHDRPWHATYPWLAGVAAGTERIRIGTMVSNPNLRHPVTLAKDAMTIDHIADGRLTIGLGAGGTGFDAAVFGQDPLSVGRRIDRLAEFTACLDGLLSGELESYRGEWYTFNEARILPGCVQQPRVPLAIAAGGRRGLRLAATFGDAWITYGDTSATERSASGTKRIVANQIETLEEHCTRLGRSPEDIDRIYLIGNTEARPLASPEAFADFVGSYRELGFTDLVFHHPRPDDPLWNDAPEIIEHIAEAHLR
jgi:alkanesulfonate monooxygenase SsuD/methylene tetrahydromethanopterin reductase-like flavin-dependent oxidoreductase (luciferase family)